MLNAFFLLTVFIYCNGHFDKDCLVLLGVWWDPFFKLSLVPKCLIDIYRISFHKLCVTALLPNLGHLTSSVKESCPLTTCLNVQKLDLVQGELKLNSTSLSSGLSGHNQAMGLTLCVSWEPQVHFQSHRQIFLEQSKNTQKIGRV